MSSYTTVSAFALKNACEAYKADRAARQAEQREALVQRRIAESQNFSKSLLGRMIRSKPMSYEEAFMDVTGSDSLFDEWVRIQISGEYWARIVDGLTDLAEVKISQGGGNVHLDEEGAHALRDFFK